MISKEVTSVFVRRVLRFGVVGALTARMMRFGVTGVWNTAFSTAVYMLCIYLGAPYPLAVLISILAAMFNNYVTFRFFVFGDRPKAPVLRYLFGFALNYVFAVAVIGFFADIIGVNEYIAGFAALPFVAAFSFALNNWFVFRAKGKEQ